VDNITAVADNGDLLLPFPPFERSNHRAAQWLPKKALICRNKREPTKF
jgi:hypothetical protein